jgi:hypothetical protein
MFKYEDLFLSEEIIADINEKVSKYNEKFWGRNPEEDPISAPETRITYSWCLGYRIITVNALGECWEYGGIVPRRT